MSDNSHLYIIYQGNAGRFNWRKVDAEGNTVRDDAGEPISSNITAPFPTQDAAKEDLLQIDPQAEIEMRPVANFAETVDEAEEREDQEAANNG